jgi:hypothetical protein
MSGRNLFASILVACLLAVGLGGLAPAANAASVWQTFLKQAESVRNNVIEIEHRGRDPQIYLPIAPSYLAYDYPYYYNRGYYPTHIGGPGYVYYGYPYYYRSSPRYGGRCSYWPTKSLRRAWMDARRCVAN